MKALNLLKALKNDTAGNLAIPFALMSSVLLLGAGVAVDTSAAHKQKTHMQNTADAAVLSAAKSGEKDPAALQVLASAAVDAHNFTGAQINTAVDVQTDGTVQVALSGAYKTQIMGMFGKRTVDINVVSEAPLGASEPVHIALVLDTTGSMRGSKLSTLKGAANNLIDKLDAYDNDNLKMSVVPFGQYVNVGPAQQGADWLQMPRNAARWQGCVGSRLAPWDTRAEYRSNKFPVMNNVSCGKPVLPLTNDLRAVKTSINGLNASGWTYIPSGLSWGWRALSTEAPFTEATGRFAGTTQKVMVVMTDGANTRSKSGTSHNGRSKADANRTTDTLCTRAKADNIEIYTIAYEINDTATKNLMRNCATETGMYFDASNAAELNQAFQQIAANLTKLRLTH